MDHLIMGHGASWRFGTRLAPIVLTCSLRISPTSTSHNLNLQETTTQDALDMGPYGAGLSGPGSSVVAKFEGEVARFEKSPIPETIGLDPLPSVSSQTLTPESEEGENHIKADGAR
jgi:hypothetical protein